MTNSTFKSATTFLSKMTFFSVFFLLNSAIILTAQTSYEYNSKLTLISEIQTGTITSNSAIIGFQLPDAVTDSLKVLWSTDHKNWTTITVKADQTFIKISNILPHTKYYYKVYSINREITTAMSPTYAFITPSDKREISQEIASVK
ncbi:MAG: fibronectin type III domain-containing protein [Saprospiraceae bacterium]|nr:fibronectin type III domain-containing protein [Saprospiraceae bacterium]